MTPSEATYRQYVTSMTGAVNAKTSSIITSIWDTTSWENPQTGSDWNNLAVMSLIDAETANGRIDVATVDAAISTLRRGIAMSDGGLCRAHLAMLTAASGEIDAALDIAMTAFTRSLQGAFMSPSVVNGLVWAPSTWAMNERRETVLGAFGVLTGDQQIVLVLARAMANMDAVFWTDKACRYLELVVRLQPDSASAQFRLGLAAIAGDRLEGLVNIQNAAELAPHDSHILQGAYLAFRTVGANDVAAMWQARGRSACHDSTQPRWQWINEATDGTTTTIVTSSGEVVSAAATLANPVTVALLADVLSIEPQAAFLTHWLRAGMTYLDEGDGNGVYTMLARATGGITGAPDAFVVHRGDIDAWCEQAGLASVDVIRTTIDDQPMAGLLGAHKTIDMHRPIILMAGTAGPQLATSDAVHQLWQQEYEMFAFLPLTCELRPLITTADVLDATTFVAIPSAMVGPVRQVMAQTEMGSALEV